jgi:hypothetical protein
LTCYTAQPEKARIRPFATLATVQCELVDKRAALDTVDCCGVLYAFDCTRALCAMCDLMMASETR